MDIRVRVLDLGNTVRVIVTVYEIRFAVLTLGIRVRVYVLEIWL